MYCPKCGYQNKDDAAFCMKCGTALNPAKAAAPSEPATAEPAAPEPSQPVTLPGYNAPSKGYQAPPPGYNAPPEGYQAPPPGYQSPAGPYTGYAPPPKKRTGLIVGLSIGGAVFIVAAVMIILLLTGSESAAGIWCNDKHAEVLELNDDGDVTVYTVNAEIDGAYEFDMRSGEGWMITDDREYDFVVDDKLMIVDDQRGYLRMSGDFDIDAFIEEAAPEPESETADETAPTALPTEDPTAPPTALPTQAPDGREFTIPGTDASVTAPEGWYNL